MHASFSREVNELIEVSFKAYAAFQTKFDYLSSIKDKKGKILTDLNGKLSPIKPFEIDLNLTTMLSGIEEHYDKCHPVLYSETIEEIKDLDGRITLSAKFADTSIHFHRLSVGGWMFPTGRFMLEIPISASISLDELNLLPSITRAIYFEPEETFEVSLENTEYEGIDGVIMKYQESLIPKVGGGELYYTYPVVNVLADKSTVNGCMKDLICSITSLNQDFDIRKPLRVRSADDTLVMISKIGSLIVTNRDIFRQYRTLLFIVMEELILLDQLRNELPELLTDTGSEQVSLADLKKTREGLKENQQRIFTRLWKYDSVEMNASHEFPNILKIFSKEFGIEKRKRDALSWLEFLQDHVSRHIDIKIEDMRTQTDQSIQRSILSLQNIFILGVTAALISTFLALSQHATLFYPLPLVNRVILLVFYSFLVFIISGALYLVFKRDSRKG